MVYGVKEEGEMREIYRSSARVVMMNHHAAGSQFCSSIYHGRYGDGATLSVDIVLPLAHRLHDELQERDLSIVGAPENLWAFKYFHGYYNAMHRKDMLTEEEMNERRVNALERAEQFGALATTDKVHCWSCATTHSDYFEGFKVGSDKIVLCTECRLDYRVLDARKCLQGRRKMIKFMIS